MPAATEILDPDFKSNETVFEKPFISPKTILHSPKISPSSIPNPSPSVTTNKQIDPGYPNYGGYLYSIPGYSAFQPVSYPGVVQPTQAPLPTPTLDNTPFSPNTTAEEIKVEDNVEINTSSEKVIEAPPATTSEAKAVESKMSITSLSQASGATVPIPIENTMKDIKKKPERFSLKTSIPISKIDIKCVHNQPEIFQKKPAVFNPAFAKTESTSRVEIQSNIIIKPPIKEPEVSESNPLPHNSTNISTLLNAAEAINKSDNQFRKPEPKIENNESKEVTPIARPIFNPINIDNKVSFPNKPTETTTFPEQKNQIVFIQNKNANPKMLLTIQQQNPQVLLQRTNFESKNLQAPSRLSNQSKKSKDDEGSTSKVVALKRCHQENCDENDFENLITENQIYGNKIVVKEKSQGTQQEQDLKNKKIEKLGSTETKNVILQPNFLYLSNVQFPTNLMMIKNNNKVNIESKVFNENKSVEASTNTADLNQPKPKTHTSEITVLKNNNNVLQTVTSKGKTDLLIQTSQKVIMNPHIVYQVPMLLNADKNQDKTTPVNREYSQIIGKKKEFPKQFEQKNDKLFIACPYQVDSKLQPKIVITNIRPKITKVDEFSSLDLYEKRRKLRRLKYLSTKDIKEVKNEAKKQQDSVRYVITPDKMKHEIYKEFVNTKLKMYELLSDSDSDYDGDMKEYESIIREYGCPKDGEKRKVEFLACLELATRDVFKGKQLELQERTLRTDAVASAYIAAGRLDKLSNGTFEYTKQTYPTPSERKIQPCDDLEKENAITVQKKRAFLSQLRLKAVSQQYKEGFERTWKEILKERKRRNGIIDKEENPKQQKIDFDTMGQLKILTEIKKSVYDNNNLIKKRLDSSCENENEESIKVLAEKNFSELNRLSKMAGRSVKLFSGKDMKKRDLNPGFDSENIQKNMIQMDHTANDNPDINIPNLSKIISLKTVQDSAVLTTTQPTSMDEPKSSAAGVMEMHEEISTTVDRVKSVGCQVEESPWQGIEVIMKNYKDYDAARKREIAELHRRNTVLRVECAHITRCASRESDRARALLAERHNLAVEENNIKLCVQRLCNAIKVIKES
ncbi:hypothetical protein K1T71_013145 [Dendrolimus kikuchii]|uniref:Uncharacterized protein n=1 Tax=Dendrolimus kikuchii TaxID=765133 RepID=A0ACC1CJ90_9NEOP|nr:hypothetical protein K1T71_013145 [Dendrolimus kikuchii]